MKKRVFYYIPPPISWTIMPRDKQKKTQLLNTFSICCHLL